MHFLHTNFGLQLFPRPTIRWQQQRLCHAFSLLCVTAGPQPPLALQVHLNPNLYGLVWATAYQNLLAEYQPIGRSEIVILSESELKTRTAALTANHISSDVNKHGASMDTTGDAHKDSTKNVSNNNHNDNNICSGNKHTTSTSSLLDAYRNALKPWVCPPWLLSNVELQSRLALMGVSV